MKDFKNTVRYVFNVPILITFLLLQQIAPVLATVTPPEDILPAPINLGWNIRSKSSTPNEMPIDLSCSGIVYTNENSVSMNWTSIEGGNIKYQREVTYPNGSKSIGFYEANNFTQFVTFGGNPGIEGLWKTKVRAFIDENSNSIYEDGEPKSDWSNECQIRYDKTAPGKPTNLRVDSKDRTQEYPCGSYLPVDTFIPDWDDITNDPSFSHYEYTSFNVGGVIGLNEVRMDQSEFVHSWTPPVEGTYGYAVRAVDLAGNKSDWALFSKTLDGSCKITYDSTPPSVPQNLRFSNPDLTCGSFTNLGRTTVDWEDSSDSSGITGYEYFIDYPLPNGGRSTWQIFRTISSYSGSLNQGLHKIKVRAKDNAGYYSAWTDFCEITYDSIEPVTIDSGTDNVLHNTDITIDLTCSDINGSGCWKTYFNINGGAFIEGNTILLTDEGNHTIHYYSIDKAGNVETEKAAANIVKIDKSSPIFDVTGATANGTDMPGDIVNGFELLTTNDPLIDHLLQFKSTTNVNEPLMGGYYGLKLINSTVDAASLKAYYDLRNPPKPFLTYLKDAVDGSKPFVYLNADSLKLVDAAKHDILGGVDMDMTVPDDYPLGTYTVQGKIMDLAGNESTVTLILKILGDREAPIVTVPSDIQVEATSTSGAVVNFVSSATDNVDGTLTVDCSPQSGSTFPLGSTPVTCSAQDSAGNEGVGMFNVTVVDTTGPLITQLGDINAGNASSPSGSIVNYATPSANDIVDGTRSVNCVPSSGSLFPVGTSIVTCSSSDLTGNTSQMSFNINVSAYIAPASFNPTRATTTNTQNVLAVGDEEVTPTPTPTLTPTLEPILRGEVLGLEEQSCDQTYKASGSIYVDLNNDGVKQEGEDAIARVKIAILTNDSMQNVELRTITSNGVGEWSSNLCPGDYKLRIDETTLPDGMDLEKNDLSLVIGEMGDVEFDIAVKQIASGFNWVYVLILGGGALILMLLFKKKQG